MVSDFIHHLEHGFQSHLNLVDILLQEEIGDLPQEAIMMMVFGLKEQEVVSIPPPAYGHQQLSKLHSIALYSDTTLQMVNGKQARMEDFILHKPVNGVKEQSMVAFTLLQERGFISQ